MGRRGGKACCWWLRVSKRWMSPAGSWNQEALPGTFPSFPLLDSKVQDAKMHRPNSGCFLELHKLLGLTWAGQNKTTEEPVRIQWQMYSPGYADGCFDWWLDQVFVTNNLLLFLTINNTLLQSGKKKKNFCWVFFKNISCAIETLQQILKTVVPFYRWGLRGWGMFALSPAVGRVQSYNSSLTLSGSKAHTFSTSPGSLLYQMLAFAVSAVHSPVLILAQVFISLFYRGLFSTSPCFTLFFQNPMQ